MEEKNKHETRYESNLIDDADWNHKRRLKYIDDEKNNRVSGK